jgi:hypothetical protein
MTFFNTRRDFGRRSNPLLDPSSSTVKAPNQQLWRHITADDATLVVGALPAVTRGGINYRSYLGGTVAIIPRNGTGIAATPGGTSTIALAVLEWVPGRNAFVDTGEALAALGAGEAASFSFAALGRIIWLHVTGITPGQSVSLYSSGNDESDR